MDTAVHYLSRPTTLRAASATIEAVSMPDAGDPVMPPTGEVLAPASDKEELAVLTRRGFSDEFLWARLGNWDL